MNKDGQAKFAFMAKYNKSTKEEVKQSQERDEIIARANMLTIPVQIRSFLRETKGEILKERKSGGKQKQFKTRKNFDEKPKFGTVGTSIYTAGEAGLLTTGNEDDEGHEKKETPEWEKFLNEKSQKVMAKLV
jgi:hypothetical protein